MSGFRRTSHRSYDGGGSSWDLAANPLAQDGLSQGLPPAMEPPVCFVCGKTPPDDAVVLESVSGADDMDKFYREAPLGSEVTVETKWKCRSCNLQEHEKTT